MQEPSLGTWAESWRRRLHHRVGDLDAVKDSADARIAQVASPPTWLIEVSMSRSKAEALSALGQCTDGFDPDQVWVALMAAWRDLLSSDPSSEDRIAKALYLIAAYGDDVPSPEAVGEMISFWDALDLAREGVTGDLAARRADFRAFLDRWSDPESYQGDASTAK